MAIASWQVGHGHRALTWEEYPRLGANTWAMDAGDGDVEGFMDDSKRRLRQAAFLRPLLLSTIGLGLLFWFWQGFANGELRQYSSGDQTGAAEAFARLGANIDTTDDKRRTPLITASSYGNVELTCFLINRGANVNAQDADGSTPLIEAARWSSVRVARPWEDFPTTVGVLLAYGAQKDMSDKSGATALSLAQKYGEKEIMTLLKKPRSETEIERADGETRQL